MGKRSKRLFIGFKKKFEERKSNPYKKGDDIDIRIRAHDSKYTIFADQVSFL